MRTWVGWEFAATFPPSAVLFASITNVKVARLRFASALLSKRREVLQRRMQLAGVHSIAA